IAVFDILQAKAALAVLVKNVPYITALFFAHAFDPDTIETDRRQFIVKGYPPRLKGIPAYPARDLLLDARHLFHRALVTSLYQGLYRRKISRTVIIEVRVDKDAVLPQLGRV